MILSHTKTQDLSLENLMWIFVFFLSLLHTQAGQTFSSYLGGPRTGGRGLPETTDRSCQGNKSSFVANTWQKKHQRRCPEPSKKFPIDSSSLPSTDSPRETTRSGRGKAAHCPFSSSQILLNYKWFSFPPFSRPLILLSFSLHHGWPSKHLQLAASLLSISICQAWNLLMQLNGRGGIMEQTDGIRLISSESVYG